MQTPHTRRSFIRRTALAAGATAAFSIRTGLHAADSPGDKIIVGIMGVNGRGTDHAKALSGINNVEIAYLCDVDTRAADKAGKAMGDKVARPPKSVKDFRRILDDKNVDALFIAAPDHWHAPATILACSAGKHVYVEKPASHNAREGELAVAAARKHNRVVQLGTQRRSYPGVIEAIQKIHAGALGRVLFSRGWYNNARASIGHGTVATPPEWLDWELWQGPAPERPFHSNYVHYNWHWFWNWGTGECGNNGIHSLDICRWGLGVDYPVRVSSGGGKYRHDDDQETPDTQTVTFDFGGKSLAWEGRSWHPRGIEGSQFGIAFYGEKGTMVIDGGGYKVFDFKGTEIDKSTAPASDKGHFDNFLDCIRTGKRPRADIEEGHKSTLLCHLGNIAWRTGHTLNTDPKTGRILNDPAAEALWSREYRPGWEPVV
jgi:predicted dehydrogenase